MKIWEDFTGAKKFNPVLSKSPNTLSKKNNTNAAAAGTASSTTATSKSSNKLSENAKN